MLEQLGGEVTAVRPHRHARHHLDARRDDHVELARPDRRGRVEVRLHRGAALAVDGRAAHGVGPAGDERGHPRDVPALLADLRHAAHLHVLDLGGVEVVPGEEAVHHLRDELVATDRAERAVPLPDRAADGVDDEGLSHRSRLQGRWRRPRPRRSCSSPASGSRRATGSRSPRPTPARSSPASRRRARQHVRTALDAAEAALAQPLPAHRRAEILAEVADALGPPAGRGRPDDLRRGRQAAQDREGRGLAGRVHVHDGRGRGAQAHRRRWCRWTPLRPARASSRSRCAGRSGSSARSAPSTSRSTSSRTSSRPRSPRAARWC